MPAGRPHAGIARATAFHRAQVIPDNSLVADSSGKVLRTLTEEEIAEMHAYTVRYSKPQTL